MIRGVIFDLDGVITDTAKFHYIAWKNLASELGIEIDEEFNETLKGIPRLDSLVKILEYGGVRQNYSDSDIDSLADKKNEEYKLLLEELSKDDILPGIEEFIDELRSNNIKIGLASVSKNAPTILKKLELIEKIDFIADPSKVAKGKPAPDIFIEAARGIGLEIENTVGIEDAESGVKAMRACNMRSVGIGVEADLTLKGTSELSLEVISMLDK
ncbi:beta-phosphoglucomutase [Peptostreptococcus porci]|uniref:beta-phosphoglucomutase n=1 Tax=Peptostreptococcus porci TaxID=2652282 RepID=UPI0023F2AD68|nr:beta-phosphoglucomutase [Peptostreptococcus porci]MDD7183958.1 beta-phosphoglucomutase [Peptostreptococcus porci]MDY4128210.1 beta-phosphoglucomutase [Peptostreptococcus porci]MDY4560701.1 beta-phosphoglucomutase [Peptostreptococcus porci]MDY5435328.1 beta-phosphoglucomutase [Peptostreptococcus porci]MDY5478986.1 beta-phosphoglucomutase [Peptostreptococcus porci]